MRIINLEYLFESLKRHASARQQLEAWYDRARNEAWGTPAKLKKLHGRASLVGKNCAAFRIMGNRYRVVVEIDYNRKLVDIRFIGSHSDYDRIDVQEV